MRQAFCFGFRNAFQHTFNRCRADYRASYRFSFLNIRSGIARTAAIFQRQSPGT